MKPLSLPRYWQGGKSKENNLSKEEFESDNEVASMPLDVFKIYYTKVDEIIVDLSEFLYDSIAKKIMKETTHKILKEDGMDRMQMDKSIFIHNTIANPVAIATAETTMSQSIEDNTHAMSLEIK